MPFDHRSLLALADPARPPPAERLPAPDALPALLRSAADHGVLPTVLAGLPPALADAVPAELRTLSRAQAANTLLLSRTAEELRDRLRQAGIAAAVVKGATFAARLYRAPRWRSFTDIDLLLAQDDCERAGALLAELGFRPETLTLKHDEGYAETKWVADRGLEVMVELHWDMIGSPTLRRGRRLDLDLLGGVEGADSAGAFLLVAALHAALGDGFTRLQPLIDLLCVVRGNAGPLDETWLRERIEQGGLDRPLALALAVAGRAFDEPLCAALARRLALPPLPAYLPRLMSDAMLVAGRRADRPLWSLRRQLLRQSMKHRGRQTGSTL